MSTRCGVVTRATSRARATPAPGPLCVRRARSVRVHAEPKEDLREFSTAGDLADEIIVRGPKPTSHRSTPPPLKSELLWN